MDLALEGDAEARNLGARAFAAIHFADFLTSTFLPFSLLRRSPAFALHA